MNTFLDWARPRLGRLQHGILTTTRTRGDLSRLRASINQPVGNDPTAAYWSLNDLPHATPRLEWASWTGFGLYAIHQQHHHTLGTHHNGIRLNQALNRLNPDRAADHARRLTAAASRNELTRIMTRIMHDLNHANIPMDHALLILDLNDWDNPSRRSRITHYWTRNLTTPQHKDA